MGHSPVFCLVPFSTIQVIGRDEVPLASIPQNVLPDMTADPHLINVVLLALTEVFGLLRSTLFLLLQTSVASSLLTFPLPSQSLFPSHISVIPQRTPVADSCSLHFSSQ